jgi:hypothetical protein
MCHSSSRRDCCQHCFSRLQLISAATTESFLITAEGREQVPERRASCGNACNCCASLCRRLADEDDELSEVQPDAVPPEVREWLASTFTRQLATTRRKSDEKPKFRSVAHAIRAGIFVDRIYRRVSNTALMQFPPDVVRVLKVSSGISADSSSLLCGSGTEVGRMPPCCEGRSLFETCFLPVSNNNSCTTGCGERLCAPSFLLFAQEV